MSIVTINGNTYTGNNVTISQNGVVIIDGKRQDDTVSGVVEVRVEGTLQNLETQASCTVNGTVLGNLDASGSVSCGEVGGDVRAGGSVRCGNVAGNLKAGGSVNMSR
jgi:hypothetical protein